MNMKPKQVDPGQMAALVAALTGSRYGMRPNPTGMQPRNNPVQAAAWQRAVAPRPKPVAPATKGQKAWFGGRGKNSSMD